MFSGTEYGYKNTYPGELKLTITSEKISIKISGETTIWLHDVKKLEKNPQLPKCDIYSAFDNVMNGKVEVRICSEKAFTLKYIDKTLKHIIMPFRVHRHVRATAMLVEPVETRAISAYNLGLCFCLLRIARP